MVKVNDEHILNKIDYNSYQERVNQINKMIDEKTGPGSDFLGWLNYPDTYDKVEFEQIKKSAEYVRQNFDILVVCGIGGSYLGARAAIEALNGLTRGKPEIIFLGQTFSSDYIYDTLNYLKDKKFAINVISKSGTTTETAISFRLLKDLLEKQIGKEAARKAIFATTDKEKGALKTLATKEGYQTFVLPSNIGGRYSVFTAVGLFPMAVANIDIDSLLKGAHKAMIELRNPNINENNAYKYAIIRDYFFNHNKQVEMFVTYEPRLTQLSEWFKQLFGESEGKEGKGLLPDSATFSTDLHSLGQFIQEGSKVLFETILYIENPNHQVVVPFDKENLDGLNYLQNKDMKFVNEKAFLGTLKAHTEVGKVPNVVLNVEKLDAYNLGYLFYFFMKTCAMSAYLLDVNPFNQPGVEVYKKNMFHLLGKEGY
ncbi:MAG TPA: glucose-6-phosphate isomerase [Firmicutes bacterium]|nr:glucose-6-phosphate isomerase [Bacillota bacterium]